MNVSEQELSTARRLADALVQFLVALDQGAVLRRAKLLKQELADPEERPPRPPIPPPPPQPQQVIIKEPSPPRERLLLGAQAAAKMLSISPRTLWSMSAPRGPIPVVQFGRSVRYSVEDLSKAIELLKKVQR